MGATGSEIWLKIHLRGATEGSESPITAHAVVINNPLNFQTDFAGSGAQNLFPLINILPAVAV